MKIPAALLLASIPALSVAACSIYDSSLLGSGGSASSTGGATGSEATASSTSGGIGGDGTGGAVACTTASECPGTDTECRTRACKAGTCGFDFAADGKLLAAQTPKDCLEAVCDGAGAPKSKVDDSDKPDDSNECTDDTCSMGVPSSPPKATGAACTTNGGKMCTATSTCVECIVNGDCASVVCDPLSNKCAPASCGDSVKNGSETDVDCGGAMCPRCATGKACSTGTDCVGDTCAGSVCAPTCTDGLKNNGEADVDCGGVNCGKCGVGSACAGSADCVTGNCLNSVCYQSHLVINEIDYDQVGADMNEFVEIYNGTGAAVPLSNLALVLIDGSSSNTYVSIPLGSGTLPAGGYLVVGSATVTVPAPGIKITNTTPIQNGPDGVALVNLKAPPALLDVLAYKGAITMANITGYGVASLVEGTLLGTGDSTTKEGSLSRLPNGNDTNNAASDWAFSDTPTPGAANVP